jgi:para-nitrobenzyl esterase
MVDPKAKLPVMVWIHGGGLVNGASSQSIYDGAKLAAKGVVLVSINYRLGAFGYLAHPENVTGNQGLLDQLFALAWVNRNITAFGGDPTKVTVFGESAGALSTATLLSTPMSKGLFERAVIESGSFVEASKRCRPLKGTLEGAPESAEDQGLRLQKALGCDNLECMRKKSAAEVLAALPGQAGFIGKGERFGPAVDKMVLMESPRASLDAGRTLKVPVIVGTNGDEGTLFTIGVPLKRELGFNWVVGKLYGASADKVKAAYPLKDYASPKAAFDALLGDGVFTCPARHAAQQLSEHGAPTYRYQFAHVPGGNKLGSFHASEIAYVFGTLGGGAKPATDEEIQLSELMQAAWVRFAQTGDPNGGGLTWPKYGKDDPYLRFEVKTTVEHGLRTAQCDVLDSVKAGEQESESSGEE